MNKSLLDTDIFSVILKSQDEIVKEKACRYISSFKQFTISVITVMEIVSGLWKKKREDKIQELMKKFQNKNEDTNIHLLKFDLDCAELAGRIHADLERTGQTIGRADPMIAAIALRNKLVLVTGNISHYKRIKDLGYNLALDNWRNLKS